MSSGDGEKEWQEGYDAAAAEYEETIAELTKKLDDAASSLRAVAISERAMIVRELCIVGELRDWGLIPADEVPHFLALSIDQEFYRTRNNQPFLGGPQVYTPPTWKVAGGTDV